MIKSLCRFSMIAATCMVAVGCTPNAAALNASAKQMELALLECKAQLGLPGQTKTEVTFFDGVPSARVVPFDQITASDAAQINACAGGATTLDDGLLVVPMQAGVAPMQPVDVVPVASLAAPMGAGECPRGRSGLYAGTSYCFSGPN